MKRLLTVLLLILTVGIGFAKAETEKSDTVTVFTIGDSTMANKPTDGDKQERGWGQLLQKQLKGNIVVDNHAMNGRSSKSFIDEGRWDKVLSLIKPGDYVIIQFGHNDEKPREKLHTDPGTTFDANLRRFVTEARERGAKPILMNSIVRRNFPPTLDTPHQGSYEQEGDVLVDTHGAYLESPRRVAAEENVPFVDMNALTHKLVTSLGREKSKELFMWIPKGEFEFCPEGKIDNTHLRPYGADTIAFIAAKSIVEVCPEFGKYVR